MPEAGNARHATVWIADGSGVPFSDLEVLDASHPGLMGGVVPYKGTVDTRVPVGTSVLEASRPDDTFVPEAEWCVGFPEGIQRYLEDPDRFTMDTPVIVQGMLEGKWVNRLAGTSEWEPASVGNNLLAEGPGIRASLAAIEEGTVAGSLAISHGLRGGGARSQSTVLGDIRGQSIFDLVRSVLVLARRSGRRIDWIDCSAQGTNAAVVNEPGRMQEAMRAAGLAPADLASREGFGRLVGSFLRSLASEDLAVPAGTPVKMEVQGADGAVVGRGELVIGQG